MVLPFLSRLQIAVQRVELLFPELPIMIQSNICLTHGTRRLIGAMEHLRATDANVLVQLRHLWISMQRARDGAEWGLPTRRFS
jgi:hypothetical protein